MMTGEEIQKISRQRSRVVCGELMLRFDLTIWNV